MSDNKSALRFLSLVSLLHRDMYWPVDRLAKRFGTTTRTIYRYLEDLERLNYHVVKDDQNRYRILGPSSQTWMPEFDPDEYIFLREAVASVQDKHPLRETILQKINDNLKLPVLGAITAQHETSRILHTLQQAMDDGVCVRLQDYYSLRSDTISDRVIEPIRMIRGMRYVLAIDRKTLSVRQFKIDRIGEAIKLKTKSTIEKGYDNWGIDDFFMNGHKGVTVALGLTTRAANLLQEEYGIPMAKLEKQKSTEFPYRYETTVYGMEGVGRFVLGLVDQIKIYSPERLKTYVGKKIVSRPAH